MFFFCVGRAIGSVLGGVCYDSLGPRSLFRGCACLAVGGIAFLSLSNLINCIISNTKHIIGKISSSETKANAAETNNNIISQEMKLFDQDPKDYGAVSPQDTKNHRICLWE